MNTKPSFATALLMAVLLAFPAVAGAAALENEVIQAMDDLAVSPASPDLLVLTDAPYVAPQGKPALAQLSVIQRLTGTTVGGGNLLFFQRPQNHPLRVLLFSRPSGEGVVISAEAAGYVSEKIQMGLAAISEKSFWECAGGYGIGRDLFTLAGIANAWAEGAPYDFLKSAELHNHICPGMTSGYLMAHYVLAHHPLAEGERYTVVACPVWCKEDALQVVLDCTPGKRSMVVKPLSDEDKAKIKIKNPAGLVLIWNAKQKTGRGLALSYDMDAMRALSPKGTPKAATVAAAVPHLDDPDRFVSTAAAFPLTEERYAKILAVDTNPYEVVGLIKK